MERRDLPATGCAGIAMSSGIGRLISELGIGRVPFVDPAPHSIDRFGVIDPTAQIQYSFNHVLMHVLEK
jgi:4-methylaminobutanoate oxidase (formaldehyde-forming)